MCVLLLTYTTWCLTRQPLPIPDPQKVFVGVTQAASSECTSGGVQKRDDQYLPWLGPGKSREEERVGVAGQPPSDLEPITLPESQPSATIDGSGKAPRMREVFCEQGEVGGLRHY